MTSKGGIHHKSQLGASNSIHASGVGDMNLSLVGMRIAPRDPLTHVAKVGIKQDVVKPDYGMGSFQQKILKERSGFSGGFKIPEDQRKKKIGRMGQNDEKDLEEDFEGTQQSHITKDEIFQHLNLGQSESGIGVGRHGTNSKTGLAKDLVEGIEKDLEKLRRQQENLQLRRTIASKGPQSVIEETDQEKEMETRYRMSTALKDEGAFVIDASPKKILAMRHQASQLNSHANLDLNDLEEMRRLNEERLKFLEEQYNRKKENAGVGKIIRERMGFTNNSSGQNSARKNDYDERDINDRDDEGARKTYDKKKSSMKNKKNQDSFTLGTPDKSEKKKKKSVKIVEGQNNIFGEINLDKQLNTAKLGGAGRQSRSVSRSQSRGPHRKATKSPAQHEMIEYQSPRRKLYEAKFEKYVANKENKDKQEKRLESMAKEDFERYIQGTKSPSKQIQRYKDSASKKNQFNKYDESTLLSKNYEDDLLRESGIDKLQRGKLQTMKEDQFRELGVPNEDKMTFFLLKWVFNAIKRESPLEDPKLKGNAYVTKTDLVKQLAKNDEIRSQLGFERAQEINESIKFFHSAKEGCLQWEEFLDFFFLKQQQKEISSATKQQQSQDVNDNWWRKIGKAKEAAEEKEERLDTVSSAQQTQQQKVPRYGSYGLKNQQEEKKEKQPVYKYDDLDKKQVKMTPSLQMLQNTRQQHVQDEVEEEFKLLQEKKQQEIKNRKENLSPVKKNPKKNIGWEGDDSFVEDTFGLKVEKSQCLLLNSQTHILHEIFSALDKYNDQILRRGEYIMKLRTDDRVVDFIDVDAVKLAYSSKILTLDEVLTEIEKDELFEQAQRGKNQEQINHKEFITWKEFMNYFNDYKEIDERNNRSKNLQKARQTLKKESSKDNLIDDKEEIGSLMEQEKQRRLKELPKLRPADQIDITEKQLQLIKDIFEGLPKAIGLGQKDAVNTIDFFIAIRKNPQIRTLASTIARDPEGVSRIPRETFQQVFDRMENSLQSKQLEWTTVVEYFTKRGRPLTKDEIQKLIDEDRRYREEEDAKKRADEEAERRRVARLMEDLEDKEDFEDFEMKQKADQVMNTNKYKYRDQDDEQDEDMRDFDSGDDEEEQDELERGSGDGYASDPEYMTAQRNYKFGQADNRRTASRNDRPKSAKTFNEKDLRNVKLTQQDYINHERSQKKKSGKYGITVPKPFGFDIRDKMKTKSIREKKVEEMVAEKQIEEENIIKHQFRHNPIPPSVLIPRYQAIQDANDRRRMQVKQNSIAITKANEKPFTFYERDKQKQKPDPEDYLTYDLRKPAFKANPIPRACSVIIFDQMMKKQQMEREERVRKQAELNYSKAKLPERMQMHQEKQKQMPMAKTETNFHSFKPKINDLITAEQFQKKQESFMKQLNKKKSQKQQTQPKSPNFTKKQTKTLEREYLNENYQQSKRSDSADKFKNALFKSIGKMVEDKAAANPSSTKAMNYMMQKRREELETHKQKEEQKKKEDEERIKQQNRLKNTVQAALVGRIKDETEKRKADMQDKKMASKKSEQATKEEIKRRIENGRSRPLLIDSDYSKKAGVTNIEKMKATMQFVEILKKNNLNPTSYLDEDQKDQYEDAKFIEAKKREYGRI